MLGPSRIADKGKKIADAMMDTTACRLAGLMFLPMSMFIKRFDRTARVEAARLYPTAPTKATHCGAVPREDWTSTSVNALQLN